MNAYTTLIEKIANSPARLVLGAGLKGLEKESLRVTPNGDIAQTPHPTGLGSALTHPYITTDYSEALLEFRTDPYPNIDDALYSLDEIHQFTYANIADELIWATSMPCKLQGDESIPIAYYGTSNLGKMKHTYRVGLAYRYGRAMQAIAGVHFNYSLADDFWPQFKDISGDPRDLQSFINDAYFRIIRNFQRWGWLVSYLFGSSPAICKSFLALRAHDFPDWDGNTCYCHHATSLRMSDIGYKNKNQINLGVSYNSLEEYARTLGLAIRRPSAEYEKIGVKVNGQYRQLNANILQIENEFYSFIRPKQIGLPGEKPSQALKRAGVRYLEVRALDVSAFDANGVNPEALYFIEALLLACLFSDSPEISPTEWQNIEKNQSQVACDGRNHDLQLIHCNGMPISMREWALELCEKTSPICELLDNQTGQTTYSKTLANQIAAVKDPLLTPSSRILSEMSNHQESFFQFAMRKSREHKQYYLNQQLETERLEEFTSTVHQSLEQQRLLESRPEIDFDEYLSNYFA